MLMQDGVVPDEFKQAWSILLLKNEILAKMN